MTKPPKFGKCVHCLAADQKLTWDHVLPLAWYPATQPRKLEKWKIPSCFDCNNAYSKLEGELLRHLALCVDPRLPETAGIAERILRSMKSGSGRNPRDKIIRERTAQKFVEKLAIGKRIPRYAAYPGLHERWARNDDEGIAVFIPAHYFHRFAEKIIRAMYFLEKQRFIEFPYVFDFYALTDIDAEPISTLLDQFGSEFALEPSIKIRIASPAEDPMISFAEITIWRQFKMYATVMLSSKPEDG